MKLRTKFAVLVTTIIITPIILTMLISFIFFVALTSDQELYHNTEIMRWLIKALNKANQGKNPDDISNDMPAGIDLIILDIDNRVLFSTIQGLEQDMIIQPDALITRFTRDYPERSLLYDPPFLTEYGSKKVFISLGYSIENLALHFSIFRWIGPIFLILLITSSVIGIIILGSFRKSIIRLEIATKRISGGDLDFELKPRGKDELASLTKSFDSMRQTLKEELAKRSRFLMAVSHDLSTPLTSIKGYIEAITDGLADDKKSQQKYLAIIAEKADILTTRIDELIEFVRMETGEWRLKRENICFKDFIEQLVSVYKEDALIFKRRFKHNIDIGESIRVTIDQSLLLRAMENLFYNALQYTKEGNEICLKAFNKNSEIIFCLEDTGSGIEKEELSHIFEPFFRGKKNANTRGFGLGLCTVKAIINAHGGEINVQSQPGEGTSFNITIPVLGKG